MSKLEDSLYFQIKTLKLPIPEREYQFAAKSVGEGAGIRKRLVDAGLKNWRFDFAWPEHKFAVEVEGGTWTGGRHSRGKGFEDDCVKYGEAMKLSWNVYRCTTNLVKDGRALKMIEVMLSKAS